MNDSRILEEYSRIARTLAQMFEPILETVVHDLRQPKSAVHAIFNSQITGRSVGDPTTDLGVRRAQGDDIPDEIINYDNVSPSGAKLKSSSIAIRNESGKLIGSLCLNLDISFFSTMGKFIEQFVSREKNQYLNSSEKFYDISAEEKLKDAIETIRTESNLHTKVLSSHDKKKIVQELKNQGLLSLKGAVSIIARYLEITRPSVYKYIGSDKV